jgi:hypothetical protein
VEYDGSTHLVGIVEIEQCTAQSLTVDGPCSIQNGSYSILDNQFGYLSTISADYATTLSTLQNRLDNHDNDVTTLSSAVSDHSTTLADNAVQLNGHDTLINQHTAAIAAVHVILDVHTEELIDHTAELLTISATLTTHTDAIDINSALLAQKQTQLGVSNRLNVSYVGDGSVVNGELATLAGITQNTTIQSQLNQLSNTLSNLDIDVNTLESLQSIDLTSFATVGDQIIALQTQDGIHTSDISSLQTDVSNAQVGLASATERLNVYDSLTLHARVTTNTDGIATHTTDIGLLQSSTASNSAAITTKQDLIDNTHKLTSSLVSTSVNTTPSTLDVVLQSFSDINDNQSTYIANINSSVTSLQNQIDTNDSELLALQTADAVHDSLITTLQGDISILQSTVSTKQNILDSGNKLSSTLVFDSTQNMQMNDVVSDIYTLLIQKQPVISTLNLLPIDKVDLTGSALQYVDVNSSIATQFTTLTDQISTLTTLQAGDVTSFQTISSNFDSIDDDIAALQSLTTNCTYLSDVTSNIQAQLDGMTTGALPSLSYDSITTTTTITNTCAVNTLTFVDGSIQTSAFDTTKSTQLATTVADVSTMQSQMSTAQSDISANASAISTKQNLLNTSNKLPIDLVDLYGHALANMDFNSSVSTKFTNVDATLTSLAAVNTTQSDNITALYSGKQDVLSVGNKLNPLYIDANGQTMSVTKMGYLSSITSDLQTQFSSKANVSAPTFTGGVTCDTLDLTSSLCVCRILEKLSSTYASFTSNLLTVDYASVNGVLYFNGLSTNTNFKLVLTNVPTTTYRSCTFSLLIDPTSFKAYASTCSINGSDRVMVASGGLANINVSSVTSSGLILQQFTIINTNAYFRVLTNVSSFY